MKIMGLLGHYWLCVQARGWRNPAPWHFLAVSAPKSQKRADAVVPANATPSGGVPLYRRDYAGHSTGLWLGGTGKIIWRVCLPDDDCRRRLAEVVELDLADDDPVRAAESPQGEQGIALDQGNDKMAYRDGRWR
jgi:hypothetical protein